MARFVSLPCPRGDGGNLLLSVAPAPEGVPERPEPGWHVAVLTQVGPRGGRSTHHCERRHRLTAREIDAACVRAVEIYEAYEGEGGGLRSSPSPA
jgi:hypothetical protein